MIYECRVLVEAFSITWVLPIAEQLSLGGSLPIGTTTNTSDGQFTAVLNGSESVGMAGGFMINSTILIKPPLDDFNNLVLTCTASKVDHDPRIYPEIITTITLSSKLCMFRILSCTL